MSYEEDTCHMRGIGPSVRVSRELDKCCAIRRIHVIGGGGYVSYEEEDTCHVNRQRTVSARASVLHAHERKLNVLTKALIAQVSSSSYDMYPPPHMTRILLLL